MLSFPNFVKHVDEIAYPDIIEPGDCSVISLINDVKKELKGGPIQPWEKWQLAITLPWNGMRHVLTTDEQLMFCFEEFDRHDKPSIEFELILVPIDMEFLVDLLGWKEGFNAENVPTREENVEGFNAENVLALEENVQHHDDELVEDVGSEPVEHAGSEPAEHSASELVKHAVSDEIDGSEDDKNYEVVDKSEDDSDVSLVDEDRVLDVGNAERYDPDGDETIIILSSDKENGLTKVARYCQDNQWSPNPNETIAFEDGQIIGNGKMTRAVVKMAQTNEWSTSMAPPTHVADVCSQMGSHPKP
ncbi:hypothetical protein LWI28_006208 [Acer negundo]|uniref:Uncharacterized protein n=1 Tax=Acer negundo TaxID=4023 RepID=A0AAD5NVZ1_ACENE|nr:hypothetical protein LWI28_006208 [Acer negundo]